MQQHVVVVTAGGPVDIHTTSYDILLFILVDIVSIKMWRLMRLLVNFVNNSETALWSYFISTIQKFTWHVVAWSNPNGLRPCGLGMRICTRVHDKLSSKRLQDYMIVKK